MRQNLGTAIGDSVSLAVIGGVVAEIGPVRTFTPVNPVDVGLLPPPATATKVPFDVPNVNVASDTLYPQYPMTAHQRLYAWPQEGIGPVRVESELTCWGVSLPPVELSGQPIREITGQDGWTLRPIASVPIFRGVNEGPPLAYSPTIPATVIPQQGNPRQYWTLYRTMPWTPTVFIRPMLLEGDTRKFWIRGVTRNNLGAALAGVNVRLIMSHLLASWMTANPFVAEVVSDGSGNYEFGVAPQLSYELHAYHEGSDVGGISVDHLQADVTVDIYCTQPGVAPPVGGSGLIVHGGMAGGLNG
jgi:hypothetical protein